MRGKALVLGAWMLVATFGAAGLLPLAPLAPLAQPAAAAAPGSPGLAVPLAFEPNLGQSDAGAFVAHGPGYAVAVGPDAVAFALASADEAAQVRMTFPGAAPATLVPGAPAAGVSHYYIGDDPQAWVRGLPRFERITLQSLWPGIDLVLYGTQDRQLEYDLVVAPGADPARARLAFDGAAPALTSSGALALATPLGTLQHRAPVSYQPDGAARLPVDSRFVLHPDGTVGFALGAFDPAKPLVIDPLLLYSQTLGGTRNASIPDPQWYPNGWEEADGVAVDGFGSAYLMGYTTSLNFPTKNPEQSVRGGYSDLFIAKFDAFGVLQYATYLGGSQNNSVNYDIGFIRERGQGGITYDLQGQAYVATSATSADFPMMNSIQGRKAGAWDAVLVKLDATGQLAQSTYFGGSSSDYAQGIGRDAAGNVVIGGYTASDDLPVTPGVLQGFRSGSWDAWLAKFPPNLTAVTYATYYGGTNQEVVSGVAVDPAGNAYLTGNSYSTNLPRLNAWQPAIKAGRDGFLAKVGPAGNSLVYATFFGGFSDDFVNGVAVDALGNAYIAGGTDSTTLEQRGVQAQPGNAGGDHDAFLAKYNSAGSLVYTTYFGGSFDDWAWAVAVDGKERAVLTGYTTSTNLPLKNPYDSTLNGQDAFVARIDTKAATQAAGLTFSTYLGGASTEHGLAVAADGPGNMYVAGITISSNFPVANSTIPPVQNPGAYGPYYDAFITAFIESCGAPPTTSASVAGTSGNAGWWRSNVLVTLTASSLSCPVPFTFHWLDGGAMQPGRLVPIAGDGTHTLVYRSRDLLGGDEANKTTTVKIDATPPVTTAVVTGLAGVGCWYRSAVDVTLQASDATSGPATGQTFHSIDGGPWVQGKTLSLSASGIHEVRFYSYDIAGNAEPVRTLRICLDFVAPDVDLLRPSGGNVYVLDIEDPLRPELPLIAVVGTLEVRAEASDDFSGVDRVAVEVDGSTRGEDHDAPYAIEWRAGSESLGDHVMCAVAYDQAGNSAEDCVTVVTVPTNPGGVIATLEEATGGDVPLAGAPGAPASTSALAALRRALAGSGHDAPPASADAFPGRDF